VDLYEYLTNGENELATHIQQSALEVNMDHAINPVIQGSDVVVPSTSDKKTDSTEALLGIYNQICSSHQAIDEFRMKLLGLLPLASLAGIFLLTKSESVLDIIGGTSNAAEPNPPIAFIAIFAAFFTLALFVYEVRGILRCHGLILKGKAIEERLKIIGQFSVCHEEHQSAERDRENYIFNAKVAACFTYSLVFAAWIFLALHRGFGVRVPHCTLWALGIGLALGFAVHWLIDKRIAP
jgi:hypothetical protein